MTFESRVLAVLDPVRQLNTTQVIKAARMDRVTCIMALKSLVDLGIVEESTYRNGRQGRPALLYRRRAQARTEAA